MDIATAYMPQEIFAPTGGGGPPSPRVFLSPQRYVQGQRVLDQIGRYISLLEVARVAVLISERGRRADGAGLIDSLASTNVDALVRIFGGECSLEEIDSHAGALADQGVDCVVAVGGGKCIDAGKAVAYRLAKPYVIVPTLASNDAPCSAVSVIYSPEGVSTGVEFYPQSPALVVVDTAVVAAAPERFLVAGMGDAMATWYEARVCRENASGVNTVGARPTLASSAIGEACADTLFREGVAAAAAVAKHVVDGALENVVEANTLLSGLGFESGGLAGAHGVAQSYTAIPAVHAKYLHGEMVAMGTLAQLVMESRPDEAIRVAEFFASVGLPVHLSQLSLAPHDEAALDTIAAATLEFPFIGNMPIELDGSAVRAAVLGAHEIGESVSRNVGDAAYRRLHGN